MGINRPRMLEIVGKSHDLLARSYGGISPLSLTSAALLDSRESFVSANVQNAVHLALKCGIKPQRFKQERSGFSSWLVRVWGPGRATCSPGIIVFTEEISKLARTKADGSPDSGNESLIAARCIYHELGHIELHQEQLLGKSAGEDGQYGAWSTPEQEEEAWVFAFAIIGSVVGYYAKDRRQKSAPDDSAGLEV